MYRHRPRNRGLMSEERFDRIEQRLDKLDADVSGLKTGLSDVKDSLGREMKLLHENLSREIEKSVRKHLGTE
jgi:archaellum component FlaC